MSNDVAIFLDIENLVIGAKQASVVFNIHLILDHIKELTNGRIVLRHAYGAGKQSQNLLQELAQAGFIVQSATRTNSFSKNLADMQIVVNAMDTLIDGHQYSTYVLISGDRDFTPLVQSLRKRGKRVIGVGIKHTTSRSLVELCDHYVYYEDLVPVTHWTHEALEDLLCRALHELFGQQERVRASVLKQRMTDLSGGTFGNEAYAESGFRNFLEQYPHLIRTIQDNTTLYVGRPLPANSERPLHLRYRTALKKQHLRVVPAGERLALLRTLIMTLQEQPSMRWRELQNYLAGKKMGGSQRAISKNKVNAVMLLARHAGVTRTLRGSSLATAPVFLVLRGKRLFPEAVLRTDATYLQAILDLDEPFDLTEAALALYENGAYVPYLQRILAALDGLTET